LALVPIQAQDATANKQRSLRELAVGLSRPPGCAIAKNLRSDMKAKFANRLVRNDCTPSEVLVKSHELKFKSERKNGSSTDKIGIGKRTTNN
jgi:hypothetical protein